LEHKETDKELLEQKIESAAKELGQDA